MVGLVCATEAAAVSEADLTVSIAAPATVQASSPMSYVVTLRNPALHKRTCVFDPQTHHRDCEMEVISKNASAVKVTVSLPSVTVTTSPPSCTFAPPVLTCTGLQVDADSLVVIPFNATSPATAGSVVATATVNPLPTNIAERSRGNNVAHATTTVTAPVQPPVLPDLFVSGSGNPITVSLTGPNVYTDIDFSISNIGTAPAQNVEVLLQTGSGARMAMLTTTNGFSCGTPGGFGNRVGLDCVGGNLAQNDTAHIIVRLAFVSLGNNAVSARADPNNAIQELTKTNNVGIVNIQVQ